MFFKERFVRKQGYSLIETLVVIFIAATLIGMASIPFLNSSPKYKLINAVREIHSRMNYARYKAIFSGNKIRLKFEPHSYTIESYHEAENKWVSEMRNILEGVQIQANNTPTFHPRGTVSNLASIYVSNSWGKFRISLAISGRIKTSEL